MQCYTLKPNIIEDEQQFSTIPWAARSPDLSCLDFYLCGRLKSPDFLRETNKQGKYNGKNSNFED